jgi:UDP-N-acetylmuramoylalanine--D-glutamate ligase
MVSPPLTTGTRGATPPAPPDKLLLHRAATLSESLDWCWRQSRPGDAILLSPACASYDQFRDCRHRAAVFRAAVAALADEGSKAS